MSVYPKNAVYPPLPIPAVSAWEILADVVLTSPSASISASFSARKLLMIFIYITGFSEDSSLYVRFNGDSNPNYSYVYDINCRGDSYYSQTEWSPMVTYIYANCPVSLLAFIHNYASYRKAVVSFLTLDEEGASGPPSKVETHGIWDNTSTQITSIEVFGYSGVTLNAGSRMVIFGRD